MDDQQLLRYSRQIMLPQIDIAGQQKLINSTVLLIGLGGLGSPIAMYLATAGVGRLIVSDFDVVDLSNLQRQILYSTDALTRRKTEAAAERLLGLNPNITLTTVDARLPASELEQYVSNVDLVIDASDNFETRFQINQSCFRHKIPLVSGAAIRFEGQVTVFDFRDETSPCYRCLYRDEAEDAARCSETGILAPVTGMIGSIQATEAIKLLLGIGKPLTGRLILIDALNMDIRTLNLKKDSECPVCSHLHPMN